MKGQPMHQVTNDLRLSPMAQTIIAEVRGGMVAAAESVPLPPRFTVTPDLHTPTMHITDTTTGCSAPVRLCDYRGVREVLTALFGMEGK